MPGRLSMCGDLKCGVNTYNKAIDIVKNRYKTPCGTVGLLSGSPALTCPPEYNHVNIKGPVRGKFKNLCLPKWWYGNL